MPTSFPPEPPAGSGSHTSTDATSGVVVATYTPPISTVVAIEVNFVARKQGGGDALTKRSTATFLTDASGVVTQVGNILTGSTHVTPGASTWAIGVDTDGALIRAKIAGQAATSIDWNVEIDLVGEAP